MTVALRLPPNLESADAARRLVEGELRPAGVDEETLFRVQLLATELVTNAVRHAGSPVELSVACRDDRIRIEARDASPEVPRPPCVDAPTRHRGLLLVEDLSDEWGVDVQDGDGKVVWFELCDA